MRAICPILMFKSIYLASEGEERSHVLSDRGKRSLWDDVATNSAWKHPLHRVRQFPHHM